MTSPLHRPSPRIPRLATRVAIGALLGFGLCASIASASMLERVTVHGLEIRQSQGSKLRQHVTAEMSRIAPDDTRSVIADNPVCHVVRDADQPPVEVTSSQLRYYLRGTDNAPLEGEPAPPLPVEVLRQWNTELMESTGLPLISDPSRGDFLFSSDVDGERVHVDMGADGELHARFLIWSEQYQRFVALGGFEQRSVNERGDRIRASGTVFTADENFANVSYPVIGDESVDIEVE